MRLPTINKPKGRGPLEEVNINTTDSDITSRVVRYALAMEERSDVLEELFKVIYQQFRDEEDLQYFEAKKLGNNGLYHEAYVAKIKSEVLEEASEYLLSKFNAAIVALYEGPPTRLEDTNTDGE